MEERWSDSSVRKCGGQTGLTGGYPESRLARNPRQGRPEIRSNNFYWRGVLDGLARLVAMPAQRQSGRSDRWFRAAGQRGAEGVAGHLPLEGVAQHKVGARGRLSPTESGSEKPTLLTTRSHALATAFACSGSQPRYLTNTFRDFGRGLERCNSQYL